MIRGYECVNIYTQDVQRLVEFYNLKLGIPIQFEGFGNYDGAKLGFNRTEPGIVIWDKNKWGESNNGNIIFVFSCDNLDKTYTELLERGIELEPPITMGWGKEMILKDPEGNKLILMEQAY